jgi:UDP-N-acetylmuramoyl-tripeptide--D-alanyl-D-alanine ligase
LKTIGGEWNKPPKKDTFSYIYLRSGIEHNGKKYTVLFLIDAEINDLTALNKLKNKLGVTNSYNMCKREDVVGVIMNGELTEKYEDTGVPILNVGKSNFRLVTRALAILVADRTSAKKIMITGSVGKSTVTAGLSFALSKFGSVVASNNANSRPAVYGKAFDSMAEPDYLVIEACGHTLYNNPVSLAIKPDISVISYVSMAHGDEFGITKEEGIADIKCNICQGTKGQVLLNRDFKVFNYAYKKVKSYGFEPITFGIDEDKDADSKIISRSFEKNLQKITADIMGEEVTFRIPFLSKGMASNFISVLSVLKVLNLDIQSVDFSDMPIAKNKQEIVVSYDMKTVINDCHNAQPQSVFDILEVFENIDGMRKILVLGDVNTYENTPKKYLAFAEPILRCNLDKLVLIGKKVQILADDLDGEVPEIISIDENLEEVYKDKVKFNEIANKLAEMVNERDAILFKVTSHGNEKNNFALKVSELLGMKK